MFLFLVVAAICVIRATSYSVDEGYEAIFYSYEDTIAEECYTLKKYELLPSDGIWILPSVAKFELNGVNFTSVLDGYGKFHKFEFKNNQLCYSSKMIQTGFYNESIDTNTIVPSVLFMDTIPSLNYNAMEILSGPNDNVYVNTNNVGNKFLSLTDSQYMIEFDINTLEVNGDIRWLDKLDMGKLSTGSAHTLKRKNCMIGIDPQSNMDMTDTIIYLYELCPESGYHRKILNSYTNNYIPYMHSFGLTENYAILPHQSFYFDYSKVIRGEPLVNSIVEINSNEPTIIKVLPINGGDVITFELDNLGSFYYFHFINCYENAEDNTIVLVLSVLSFNMLPYYTLEMERNKTTRDAATFGNVVVKKITLDMSDPTHKKYTSEDLTNIKRSTDFPSSNKEYTGLKSCILYAIEWFHDEKTYADMAIIKTNYCTNEVSYWYKENYFPSEPTFVPSKNSKSEDDGHILFTAVHGITKKSYLIIVDPKTMESIEEVEIPGVVTFTTHGEWYSN